MKENNIIFLADAFGYGPITTLLLIAEQLRKKTNAKFIFIGPKLCVNYLNKSNIFDQIIEAEYTEDLIRKHKKTFINALKIIAVETTDILISLINNFQLDNIYLIDNLFWMWDFLEPELKKINRYYISNVIDCSSNKKRIAKDFNNIVEVGCLRKLNEFHSVTNENIIISLGGVESYMFDDQIVKNTYLNSIKTILNNKNIKKFKKIYIAGGTNIIEYIKKNINGNNIIIDSFSNNDYLKILHNCSHAIMSPGLGNFNEIISTDIKCMFLLPINYSQYLQRIEFEKLNIGFHFQKNINEKQIEKYLDEKKGVNQVIENLYTYNIENFENELNLYFDSDNNMLERLKFYKKINKNGIEKICEDIME